MTQQKILEYNKRCAEFLGVKFEIHSSTWRYKNLIVTELLFHSDWNWIMEVVAAIERLNENRYYVSILESECSIIDKQAAENEENPFMIEPVATCLEATSKKEAVVQAINQFLIWYNNGTN